MKKRKYYVLIMKVILQKYSNQNPLTLKKKSTDSLTFCTTFTFLAIFRFCLPRNLAHVFFYRYNLNYHIMFCNIYDILIIGHVY